MPRQEGDSVNNSANHSVARSILVSTLGLVQIIASPALAKSPPLGQTGEISRHGSASAPVHELEPQVVVQTLGGYLLVPVAGNVEGIGGTHFKTDLIIRNGSNSFQNVQLIFLRANQDNSTPSPTTTVAHMEALSTFTYEDVFGTLLRQTGLGAILLKATDSELGDDLPAVPAKLHAAYRIYTAQPGGNGTTSQSGDAVDLTGSKYFEAGTTAGLRQDQSFRTNVGIVNLSPNAVRTFRVTASGGSGGAVTMDITVPPQSMTQRPLPAASLGNVTLRIELLFPDGENPAYWTAYGSTVDNITGDSRLQMITPD